MLPISGSLVGRIFDGGTLFLSVIVLYGLKYMHVLDYITSGG